MYAELRVVLKAGVQPEIIRGPLAKYFGQSRIEVVEALADTPIATYANQGVGAASFPSGAIVAFLCTANDEISVYVFGKSIPQLKDQCSKSLKPLRKIEGVKISSASASILVPLNGTDTDILTGVEISWWALFGDALLDKSISKLISAAATAALAVWLLNTTATPTISALIGLAATTISVLFEAIHSACGAESWCWKESK